MTETPKPDLPHEEWPLDEGILEATEEPIAGPPPPQEPSAEPARKNCLFCGADLPAMARACPGCGHALGPFEASTPKEYFRWFFCGLLVVVGTLMPCGPDWGTMTLRTLTGGLFFIVGLGVLWNMWSAIYAGRFKMFWLVMLFIPAIWGVWRIAFAFSGGLDDPLSGISQMKAHGVHGWGFLGEVFRSAPPKWGLLRNFFWVVGYGPVMITLGSVLAWVFLVSGMVGAVRHSKKKAAERSAGGSRARRR